MSVVELAEKIFYDVFQLKNTSGEEKFQLVHEKYRDLTMLCPIIVKYMCYYDLFDSKLFREYIEIRDKEARSTYENGFVMQTNYIKKLLIKNKYSRIEALKISNQELDFVLKEVKKIKKKNDVLKKNMDNTRRDNILDVKKEFKAKLDEIINKYGELSESDRDKIEIDEITE